MGGVTLWLEFIRLPRTTWAWKGILCSPIFKRNPSPGCHLDCSLMKPGWEWTTHVNHSWTPDPQQLWDNKRVLFIAQVCGNLQYRNRWLIYLFTHWFTQSDSGSSWEINWPPGLLIPTLHFHELSPCLQMSFPEAEKDGKTYHCCLKGYQCLHLVQINRELDKKDFTDRGLWISLNQHSKDRQPGLLGWPGWYFLGPGSPSSVLLLQLEGGGSCSPAPYLTRGHVWCHFCISGRRASLTPPAACHSHHLQAVSCVFF